MDFLLEDRQLAGRQISSDFICKANDQYIASSNVTFFSAARLASLSHRLGHSKVRSIIDSIEAILQEKTTTSTDFFQSFTACSRTDPLGESDEARQSYINSYFENVHPVYPFLHRPRFEQQALGSERDHHLASSAAFFALYHAVLALGSQYHDGGTFEAGRGKAWKYFYTALCRLPEILIPKGTLTNAQAMTAMAIFALNFAGMQLDETLISEAARIARVLGLHNSGCMHGINEDCHRTFWVIYSLEKDFSFSAGIPSAILDYQIGCPIPSVSDSRFGDLDWFLAYARFARLLSKAHETLFSVTATLKTRDAYYHAVDSVQAELDAWKRSLPLDFQAGQPLRRHGMQRPAHVTVALRTRLAYYNLSIILARLTLHIGGGSEQTARQAASVQALLDAARAILDLTRHIEQEAYTPLWMLGVMPLVALFILFDFVVHNPAHAETRLNLAFLDVAAGHLSSLEVSSGGALPGSLLAEFAHIARQHVQDSAAVKESASATATPQTQENSGGCKGDHNSEQAAVGLPAEMQASAHNAFGNVFAPDSLFFPDVDATMALDPQGFDIMGLFGSAQLFGLPFEQFAKTQARPAG